MKALLSDRIYDSTEVPDLMRKRSYHFQTRVAPGQHTRDVCAEFWLMAFALWHVCKRYAVPIAFALGLIIGYAARATANDAIPPPGIGSGAAAQVDSQAAALANQVQSTAADLVVPDLSDGVTIAKPIFDLETALCAFVLARTDLTVSQAEAFAAACMQWPDPRWACAMGLAESGGKSSAVNSSSGCRGYWQIHPCHRKAMANQGLDFRHEADRTTFAIGMYAAQGSKPWAASKPKTRKLLRAINIATEAK